MIASFDTFPKDNLSTCGMKGKCLIEMKKAGFTVPNGFIINSDEFISFCKENNIFEKPINEIHPSIIKGIFPQKMKQEILDLYSSTFPNNERVAVRSSALCEDGTEFAWSGELESFLFVEKDDLLFNIKKCFASLFTDRALTYAKLANLNRADMQVAVIVQKQIDSEFAGVAFSDDPLSGENEIMIEVVAGQGERLVSGLEIPDRYSFTYKKELISSTLSESSIHINTFSLMKVVDEVLKMKELYGYPVDVEWAIESNSLFILQCRPITTIINSKRINNLKSELLPTTKWEYDTQGAFHYLIMHTIILAADASSQDKVFGFHRKIEDNLCFNGQLFKSKLAKHYLCEEMLRKMSEDNQFLTNFANMWSNVFKWEKEYVSHLKSIIWQDVPLYRLIQEARIFKEKYTLSLVYTYYYIEDFLEESIKLQLKKEYSWDDGKCDTILNNIASCSNELGELSYSQEPIDLLRIASKKQKGEDIEEDLTYHVSKYGWMLAPIEKEFRVFEKEHYEKRIDKWLSSGNVDNKLHEMLNNRKENDITYYKVKSEYNFSDTLSYLADSTRSFIFYRTLLTECSDWMFFNGRITLLREIAHRTGISENDIVMLSMDEIISLLENKIPNEEIKARTNRRSKRYAILYLNNEMISLDGDEAIFVENSFVPLFVRNAKKELAEDQMQLNDTPYVEGNCCYPGKIIGHAKIVKSLEDCEKVKEGDILVANMTTPNFISAMERASGFVTDQGGITCHAAILSREMKIPCVIGTSIATSVFHDGELIELDAYIGRVRAIESI